MHSLKKVLGKLGVADSSVIELFPMFLDYMGEPTASLAATSTFEPDDCSIGALRDADDFLGANAQPLGLRFGNQPLGRARRHRVNRSVAGYHEFTQ